MWSFLSHSVFGKRGTEDRKRTLRCWALTLMITHECDAMYHHEWRVLPLTSFLPEEIAWRVFVIGHVPLTLGLLMASTSSNRATVKTFDKWFGGFCVVHLGLHLLFWCHPENSFNNLQSQAIISACAAVGALLYHEAS